MGAESKCLACTPEHLVRLGTPGMNGTQVAHLRPVPDSPPSAGICFLDSQGADPAEGAGEEVRGSPKGDRGWGGGYELPLSSHLHVPLPGGPPFRHFLGFGGGMENEMKFYLQEGYTRESHSPRP